MGKKSKRSADQEHHFEPVESPYRVPFDGSFDIRNAETRPHKKDRDDEQNLARLGQSIERLGKLQERLMAGDRHALLVVFQAMDAAGKDGTLRAVMTGVNPAGVEVHAFKAPSTLERSHDFLWRVWQVLPAHGRIGIWNRSHYEEVLTVRVHPELLLGQKLPEPRDLETLFEQRLHSIREMEKHLARNGTTIVKFWLNVGKEEQKERLIERARDPDAHWKFAAGDVRERKHWKAYMRAYESALNETSRPWAPWYAIPADDKKYMRAAVADVLVKTLEAIDPRFPELEPDAKAEMDDAVRELERE